MISLPNSNSDSSPAQGGLWKSRASKTAVVLAVAGLVQQLMASYDVNQGMRVGAGYTTNTMGSNSSLMVGTYNTGDATLSLAVGNGNALGDSNSGFGSLAAGTSNTLSGYTKFAFGDHNTLTGGYASMAVGSYNNSSGGFSLTVGDNNQTGGNAVSSLTAGSWNATAGKRAVVLGERNNGNTLNSLVIGQYNLAITGETDTAAQTTWRAADPLFVVGNGTSSARSNALVVTKNGAVDIPAGPLKVAGQTVLTVGTTSNGGLLSVGPSVASNWASIAMGYNAQATGRESFAFGYNAFTGGNGAVILGGYTNNAYGYSSFAGGVQSVAGPSQNYWSEQGGAGAIGACSFAYGWNVLAEGRESVSFGQSNKSKGLTTTTVGASNSAWGFSSFAGGVESTAGTETGYWGQQSVSGAGAQAFAYGYQVIAEGRGSVAFGQSNISTGEGAVTTGYDNKAKAAGAAAMGYSNRAWRKGQFTVGRYSAEGETTGSTNMLETDEVFVVGGGNGTATAQRKNAMVVQASGDTAILGTLKVGTAIVGSNGSGSAVFDKPVILQPGAVAGDIPMYNPSGS